MSLDVDDRPQEPLPVRGLVAVGWARSRSALGRLSLTELGAVRVRELPLATRALVRVGFVLLALMLLLLVSADLLRASGPLVAGSGGEAGRGSLLPEAALPATLFTIAVAWTYLLTGGLHAHPALRLGLLLAYCGTTSSWFVGSLGTTRERVVSWVLLAAVPLWYAVRWRARPRPGLEFLVLLALVGGEHVFVQRLLLDAWRISGVATFLPTVQTTVLLVGSFVTPLLIMVGIDVAEFILRTAASIGSSARRLPPLLLGGATATAVGLAAWQALTALWRGEAGGPLAFVGALGIPVLCALVVLLVRRLARGRDPAAGAAPEPAPPAPTDTRLPDDPAVPPEQAEAASPAEAEAETAPVETDEPVAAPASAERPSRPTPGAEVLDVATQNATRLALAFSGWEVLLVVLVLVALAVFSAGGLAAEGFVTSLISLVTSLTGSGQEVWLVVLTGIAAVASPVLARAGRTTTATYLGLVGVSALWSRVTAEGAPLEVLDWPGRPTITFWWTTVLVVGTVVLAWRRRLDADRQEVAVLLAVVLLLAGRAEAVGDPFSPFFAFAGLGLVVLGVAWDALTIGSWANEGSRAFPRDDRMLLYLGYVLFSVAVIAWSVATHDVESVEYFTEGATDIGLAYFGIPVLYATYVLGLERLLSPTTA